jgi:transposase
MRSDKSSHSEDGHDKIKRNKYFKNKNCNKISMITDTNGTRSNKLSRSDNGIPLSVLINSGNVHDLSFIEKHMKDIYFLTKKNNNILLADKTYESSKYREYINKFNYQFMIPKKKNMIKKYYFDKNIYKSRTIIENTFQKLKVFRRIMNRYDSLFKNYFSFVYLGCSILIHNYINK